MRDSLKKKMRAGELTVGSWLSFGYVQTCEMMLAGRFDWLVIDREHTCIGLDQLFGLVQVIDLGGSVPLVRVGSNDPLEIKRALDAGAHGVVVPMINTREQAAAAVESVYYPPTGKRGVGLSRAQGYGMQFEEYRSRSAEESVLIVQIEHVDALDNLEEIMALDGVDGFLVGPYDLSGSLGLPGQFDAPPVQATMNRVTNFIKTCGKPGGFHVVASDRKALQERIAAGCRLMAYGDDMVFLGEKIAAEAAFIRDLPRSRTGQ